MAQLPRGSGNLGDCRNLTWKQISQRFLNAYMGVANYSQWELEAIDKKWRKVLADIGWQVKP